MDDIDPQAVSEFIADMLAAGESWAEVKRFLEDLTEEEWHFEEVEWMIEIAMELMPV